MRIPRIIGSLVTVIISAIALAVTGGCSIGGASHASSSAVVRIGYFPNITHAPALVADTHGYFTQRLGADNFTTQTFNAGPDELQALLSGSLDIAYLGPNPTITGYTQSNGAAIRVIAGSTSGGAALVVKPAITTAAQLRGKKLATPQLGNTQDVALRHWLTSQGLHATTDGGGDVAVMPNKNAAAVTAFSTGQIDGAWVPEPYVSQLKAKGGHVLVDEASLWPQGKFVTTNVVVRTEFLKRNPAIVTAFLQAHLDALDLIAKDPAQARVDTAKQLTKITEQTTTAESLTTAWENLTFTADPLAATVRTSAENAHSVGLLTTVPSDKFAQLWDTTLLNQALAERQQPTVTTS